MATILGYVGAYSNDQLQQLAKPVTTDSWCSYPDHSTVHFISENKKVYTSPQFFMEFVLPTVLGSLMDTDANDLDAPAVAFLALPANYLALNGITY